MQTTCNVGIEDNVEILTPCLNAKEAVWHGILTDGCVDWVTEQDKDYTISKVITIIKTNMHVNARREERSVLVC